MTSASAGPGPRPTSPLARMPDALRRLPVYHADVLVVGSGAAGLAAALSAADAGAHVMVLSKGSLQDTNTLWAQGGIAAAVAGEDDPSLHAADTQRLGYGLSEREAVDAITRGGPETMRWLIEAGMAFDRTPDGALALGREGGHRVPRILHSGGTCTGRELQRVLGARAQQHPHVDVQPDVTAVELLKDSEGEVAGLVALAHRGRGVEPVVFEAAATVLATGGGGQIYRETTNPQLATGDGVAMALRAGAELRDLEFVQFHPTILYLAGAARFLISEITRGAGAVLRDREGRALLADVHEDRDLAPRDVVSRAIFRRMVETGDTHVYLDMSAVEDAARRFPELARIAGEFGIDVGSDPVPVRPAVHYFVGGIATDLCGRSSLPGLWAVGECASTGFHGANRMGSNSLLEGLVHGRLTGAGLADALRPRTRRFVHPETGASAGATDLQLNLADMTYSLKSLMWRQVGVERDGAGLADAVERLRQWEGYLARLGPFSGAGVEIWNMVQVAQCVARCALFREESRGAHYRTDFPESNEAWRAHTRLRSGADGWHVERGGVPAAATEDAALRGGPA